MLAGLSGLFASRKGVMSIVGSVISTVAGEYLGADPDTILATVGSLFGVNIASQGAVDYAERKAVATTGDLGFSSGDFKFKPPVAPPGPGSPQIPPPGSVPGAMGGFSSVGMTLLVACIGLGLVGCKGALARNVATMRVTVAGPDEGTGERTLVLDARSNGDVVVGYASMDATLELFDRSSGKAITGPFEIQGSPKVFVWSKSRGESITLDPLTPLPAWLFQEGFFRPGELNLLAYAKEPEDLITASP